MNFIEFWFISAAGIRQFAGAEIAEMIIDIAMVLQQFIPFVRLKHTEIIT